MRLQEDEEQQQQQQQAVEEEEEEEEEGVEGMDEDRMPGTDLAVHGALSWLVVVRWGGGGGGFAALNG